MKDQGGDVLAPAREMGDLHHVVIDAGIQQQEFQFLGLVGEALDVQHGVGGDHALPGSTCYIRVVVSQTLQPHQGGLAIFLHPGRVLRVEEVQMFTQRPVDLLVGGDQTGRGRGAGKGTAQRLLLGALVVQSAVGNQPGRLVGDLGAQVGVGVAGQRRGGWIGHRHEKGQGMLPRAGLKLGMPSGHGVQSVAVWLLPGLLLHTTCAGCNKFTGMATGQPACPSGRRHGAPGGTDPTHVAAAAQQRPPGRSSCHRGGGCR